MKHEHQTQINSAMLVILIGIAGWCLRETIRNGNDGTAMRTELVSIGLSLKDIQGNVKEVTREAELHGNRISVLEAKVDAKFK